MGLNTSTHLARPLLSLMKQGMLSVDTYYLINADVLVCSTILITHLPVLLKFEIE